MRTARSVPRPVDCVLNGAGHAPVSISVLKAVADKEHPAFSAEIVEVDGIHLTVRSEGELRTFRNHDLKRLVRIVERLEPRIILRDRWRLLVAEYDEGTYWFSLLPDDGQPWRKCRPTGKRRR